MRYLKNSWSLTLYLSVAFLLVGVVNSSTNIVIYRHLLPNLYIAEISWDLILKRSMLMEVQWPLDILWVQQVLSENFKFIKLCCCNLKRFVTVRIFKLIGECVFMHE